MSDSKKFDVFISYRNSYFELQPDGTKRQIDVGFGVAKDVSGVLYSTNYRVYFDNLSLSCGDDYERHIFESIPQCKDVILILVPQALDRCTGENDIFGREIVAALENGKNIIPVFVNGFTLPESIDELPEMLRVPAKKYLEETGRSFVRLQGVKVRAEEKVSAENFQILKSMILAGVVPRLKSVPVQDAQLNPRPADIPEGTTTPYMLKQEELRKREEELRKQEDRLLWEKEERARREEEQRRLDEDRRKKEEEERVRREAERVQGKKNLLKLVCSLAVLAVVALALAKFLTAAPAAGTRDECAPAEETEGETVIAGTGDGGTGTQPQGGDKTDTAGTQGGSNEKTVPAPDDHVDPPPIIDEPPPPPPETVEPISVEELVAAVKDGNAERVSEILASGTDVNARAGNGATALCSAAMRSNVELVSALLDAGADPNIAVAESGLTPLHIAAAQDSAPCVKLLLAADADVAAQTATGLVPADFAKSDEVRKLLENFAKK